MSYIIPTRDLGIEKRAAFRNAAIENGVRFALSTGLARTREELSVRDLLPVDIGLKYWQVNLKAGNITWIFTTIQNSMIVTIYKIMVLCPDPGAIQLHIYNNNSARTGMYPLEPLYAEIPFWKMITDSMMSPEAREVMNRMTGPPVKIQPEIGAMEGYFSEIHGYKPNSSIRMDLVSNKDSIDRIMLGGFVIERRGTSII